MIQTAKSFLRFLGIDRAVFFSNATQVLRLVTGPISMVLVLRYLTPEIQGYFYTFSGIVAMQVFLEMGFSQNILQFASHEFSKLRFTQKVTLEGDTEALSRLISLGRLAFGYYAVASLLMMLLIGIGGHLFFTYSGNHGVSWKGAWWLIVVTSSLSLAINPVWALLEGCNRIVEVAKFRLWSSLCAFLVNAVAFIAGAGIYVPAIGSVFLLLFSGSYMILFWRSFLGQFLIPPQHGKVSWFEEIWPFQWRIAVSWISGYFIYSIINPVVFYFCGAADAGRFGMSFQLVRMVSSVAMPWVNTKAPRFGMLVAGKKWAELDSLWRRSTIQAFCMTVLGMALLLLAIPIVGHFLPQFPKRLTSLAIIAWLGGTTIVQLLVNSMAVQLRAHKQEPYMWISVWSAALNMIFILPLAWSWGIYGVAVGYSIAAWIILIPSINIYRRKQIEYRSDPKDRIQLAEVASRH